MLFFEICFVFYCFRSVLGFEKSFVVCFEKCVSGGLVGLTSENPFG
jgi:hypothetical protein